MTTPPDTRPPARRRPRPDAARLVDETTALNNRLPHLADIIRTLHEHADAVGYPTRASGADTSDTGDGDGLTVPERYAEHGDPHAERAIGDLALLEDVARVLARANNVLARLEPNRAIKRCLSCGAPWEDHWRQCQAELPSGGRCLARRDGVELDVAGDRCGNPNCGGPLKANDRVTGSDGVTRDRRCHAYLAKYDRERPMVVDTGRTAGVAALVDGVADIVIDDGAATMPDTEEVTA